MSYRRVGYPMQCTKGLIEVTVDQCVEPQTFLGTLLISRHHVSRYNREMFCGR